MSTITIEVDSETVAMLEFVRRIAGSKDSIEVCAAVILKSLADGSATYAVRPRPKDKPGDAEPAITP